MKKIQLLLLLSIFSTCLQAQTNTEMDYAIRLQQLKKTKTTGIILTGLGTVATGIGVHLISKNNSSYMCSSRMPDGYYTGKKVATAGLIGVGAGIATWIVGGIKLKNFKKRIQIDAGASNAVVIFHF